MTHSPGPAVANRVGDLLAAAGAALDPGDAPQRVAEALMAHVLGRSRAYLWAHRDQVIDAEPAGQFQRLVARAAQGEPLAYLTGHREFCGLDFQVDAQVLIPRPETELIVDLAVQTLSPRVSPLPVIIIDIGTGSGCLAVTLAARFPAARVLATDVSAEALARARANAARQGLAAQIAFVQADLLAACQFQAPARVLLVANLPYIASAELAVLPVSKYEPRLALDGGPDGLGLLRRLLVEAQRALRQPADLLLEIGATQGAAVAALARQSFPAAQITRHPDLAGLDRVVAVRLS